MIKVDPCSGTHSFQLIYHSLVFILLCISPEEKLLVHKADCSTSSSCEVRNTSSYTSTPYVPSWCAGQIHLYFDNELKTSEIGQCEILKLVKSCVLPMTENTFMVQELYSSWLLRIK